MIDGQQTLVNTIELTVAPSLTVRFLQVGSLIPESQDLLPVSPSMTLSKAIELMQRRGYSQLPVVHRGRILGVVSYRSIGTQLLKLGREAVDLAALPVGEFVESAPITDGDQELQDIFDALDKYDTVLVGRRDNLLGVITAIDGLVHLYQLASPSVLLAEIELSLRKLINACADAATLQRCAETALLFERFVRRFAEQLLKGCHYRVRYLHHDRSIPWQAGRPYRTVVPDLLVETVPPGPCRLPVDAKYKGYDEQRLNPANIYQSFLYAFAFNSLGPEVPQALLVYPTIQDSIRTSQLEIRNAAGQPGAQIRALGIHLSEALTEATSGGVGTVSSALLEALAKPLLVQPLSVEGAT